MLKQTALIMMLLGLLNSPLAWSQDDLDGDDTEMQADDDEAPGDDVDMQDEDESSGDDTEMQDEDEASGDEADVQEEESAGDEADVQEEEESSGSEDAATDQINDESLADAPRAQRPLSLGANHAMAWATAPEALAARAAHQQELVSISPLGKQVIADSSGHFSQFTQSDLVISTIREAANSSLKPKPLRDPA